MSKAKITLIGMYKWMSDNNDDLFYNLSTPVGIDKQKLVNTILMNGAEFEVLYADADFMKFLIGVWSDKWQRTMEKWINALSIEYNPLENYDRKEDWLETSENKTSRADGSSRLESIARKEIAQGNDISLSSGDGSTENQISAYDVNTYSPHDKATSSSSGSNNSSSLTDADGKTNSMIIDQSNGDIKNKEDSLRSGRTHGNIGVTTSQQMLESELDIAKFNVYDEIANLFLTEFVIYTY